MRMIDRISRIRSARRERGVTVVVLGVLLALLAACSGSDATPTPTTPPTPNLPPVSTSGGSPPPGAGAAPVSVLEPSVLALERDPHTVLVAVGATVTWRNDDDEPHAVTSDGGWFGAQLAPGESYSWQPTRPGVFQYHDELHDKALGVIVVSEGGAITPEYYAGQPIAKYFADSCGGCHGSERQGAVGPALIPGRLTARDDFYFDAIKNGRPGTIMPAWGDLGLGDEEIWGLVGFIQSEPEAAVSDWTFEQIAASLTVLVDEATLPDAPEHDGALDNLMFVTERENRSIAAIDGDTHQLLGHIDASYRAHGYAFDPTTDRWLYNVGRDGWVFKIDAYTLQAVRKVRVGHDSRGLAISDDGRYLMAGNFIPTTAVLLDGLTLEPLKVIQAEGVDPDGNFVRSRVAITSDVSPELVGPYFIIALKEAGQVWRIDYSDPDFAIDKVENAGRILHDGFLSADNRYFYLASQQDDWMVVIDVQDWTVVERIPTGDTPHPGSGAVWEADGTTYGATTHAGEGKVAIWDLATNEVVGVVATQGPGLFIRAAENSPFVWADALFADPSNTITVFRKEAPFEVVGVVEEGVMTLHPEFTADGSQVYISDWTGEVVRVYDATTLEKVAEITGITTPTGIFSAERRHERLGH